MDLSIYSVWGAGVAFLVAWLTAHALTRVFGAPPSDGRFATIDGLRGFLAFSVFMHHNVIWFVYLRTGQWVAPQSALFRHFGESAVALFFMITAFLFTTKVLNSRERPIDWTRLYVGRLTRLFPMYAVAVTVVWVMAWLLTGHARNVGWGTLLDEFVHWLAFTIRDHPDVNGLAGTSILIAGVTWSLPYEWWFYLSLPFLALVLRRRPPATWLRAGRAVASVALALSAAVCLLLLPVTFREAFDIDLDRVANSADQVVQMANCRAGLPAVANQQVSPRLSDEHLCQVADFLTRG